MDTRDFSELIHFKGLRDEWWNPNGSFKVLHQVTPCRLLFLKEHVGRYFSLAVQERQPFQRLRILDIGCGGGLLSEPLARLGAEVLGIDPVEDALVCARAHAHESHLVISYLPCTIETLPPEEGLFDVIVASEVLEHVNHPHEFLRACKDRLKPKGGLFLSTFNKTLKSYLFGILGAEYILKWAPHGTHRWEKFISPENLTGQLMDLGFSHQEMRGLSFSPFRREWSLSSALDINYFVWADKG